MSGFVGIFDLEDSPVNPAELFTMIDRIRYRGPDGITWFVEDRIGLGHALLAATPEDTPIAEIPSLGGEYYVAADACLYNRKDLIIKLGADLGQNPAAVPDSTLILHAYRRWGTECPKQLIGDFSFAIWDRPKGRLLLARDPLGIRQLYYARHKNRVLFATDIEAILTALPRATPLNRELLQQILLLDNQSWVSQTVYSQVKKLAPGHCASASRRVAVTQYFKVDRFDLIKHKSQQDYVEQFNEIFDNAVSGRLRSKGSPGLVVSGGIDSSTIAAATGKIYTRLPRETPRPIFYSYAGRDCRSCDDWTYLQHLVDFFPDWGKTLIDGDDLWALKNTPADRDYQACEPEAALTTRGWTDLALAANKDQTRTLITGYGGDELMLGDAYHFPHLLSHLPLKELAAEFKHFKQASDLSSLQLLDFGLFRPALKRLLPGPLLELARSGLRKNIRPKWISGHPLKEHRPDPSPIFQDGAPQEYLGYQAIWNGSYQRAFSAMDQVGALRHLEHRHPFYDTRILELVLRFPIRLLFQNGWTKWLLRQASTGYLPDAIRERKTYCTSEAWITRGWKELERKRIEVLLKNPMSVDLRLVDQPGLENAWRDYWLGDNSELWYLSAWLNIESWLQSRGNLRPCT